VFKAEKSNVSRPTLRSFRDVTRGVGTKRGANKRKIKLRDLNRLRSNSHTSMDASQNHDANLQSLRDDDSSRPRADRNRSIRAGISRERVIRFSAADLVGKSRACLSATGVCSNFCGIDASPAERVEDEISLGARYQVAGFFPSGMTSETISHRNFQHTFRSACAFSCRKTTTLSG
jgi:hypothetical protein